jgi:site-specific recombinase XerD
VSDAVIAVVPPAAALPSQAGSDEHLIRLWLHDKSANAQRAYLADISRFLAFVEKPLRAVTLDDLQAFADTLSRPNREGKLVLTPAGRRAVAATKSLLTFGQRVGYLQFNVGAAVRVRRPSQHRLSERILPEAAVQEVLHAAKGHPRNHALLRFLYASALRVSEVSALRWRDFQPLDDGAAIVIVHGKGERSRNVRLEPGPWAEVSALRGAAGPDDPVFRSRKGAALHPAQVWRIVRATAQKAGLDAAVSPHWLRHAHASHAIERGAPIPLVRDTLGHANIATTNVYLHARPGESSGRYLAV